MTQDPIIEHLTERFKKFPNSKTHFISAERWQALLKHINSVGFVQGSVHEIRVSGNVIKPVDNIMIDGNHAAFNDLYRRATPR